ncbi:hypothetical protein llap_9608 [Limosa lapponica baueri]|uniref:Uncharacterized protein n=1 Tax=Limosa lapponica baueri TaxID=1758121 RepID=A0A2I0U237_LIMLA|nr:hypothetical protein llap_9608 [Limosa lapponica baueri]
MDIGAAFCPNDLDHFNTALGSSHACFQEWSENELASPSLYGKTIIKSSRQFLDKYENLAEADIRGIQVKPLVLSLSEQPGQMILLAFLETILIEFRANSGLPNSDSEDPVEEKIPNSTGRLNELSAKSLIPQNVQ